MKTLPNIKSILADASDITKRLLRNQITPPKNIPIARGVYLIKNKRGKIIYVGKAKNLNTRISNDHLGKNEKKSTFRRKLKKPRKWVMQNCRFVYEVVLDSDMCGLVEALAIVLLRSHEKLLNSEK